MVNLNTFSDEKKGKEKEVRLDPPPLDDGYDDDYMQDPIDISDGDSDFGSGYSEVGLLEEEEEEEGPLFDEEGNPHGIGSTTGDASHLPTTSEPSPSPKGPVRFSLKPVIRRFSFLGASSEGTSSGGSNEARFPNMLCVICDEQPAYNDGHRTFPTCGNTCAAKLEAARGISPNSRTKNHSHTPIRAGQRPQNMASSNESRQAKANVIRMCDVCRSRPRYQKNGKIYPTCGLTCAARLQRSGSVDMCELCKKRPRVVINGHKFPHCGRKCRDKAKADGRSGSGKPVALVPKARPAPEVASCTSCLMCWKANRIGIDNDFCSERCKEFADKKAPFLLEIPRGHIAFKEVTDLFSSSWRHPLAPCPAVKKVYMVILKPSFGANYDLYRTSVSNGLFKRKGNERRTWLGIPRVCGLGDSGNTVPCQSGKCVLCSLVRTSLSEELAQGGILISSSLARAVDQSSKRVRKGPSLKVVLLANVLFGREIEKGRHELVLPLPPQGYDSVHLVEQRLVGGKIDHGEFLVFDGDAIKPLYLVAHE